METPRIPSLILIIYLGLAGAFLLPSCTNSLGTKVKEPFTSDKYQSSKRFYRATGKGESTDLSIAKSKARVSAKRNLAGHVKTSMRSVTDLYLGDRDNNIAFDVKEKFESLTREVIHQDIGQISVIGEQSFENHGIYTSYLAYEINKKQMYKHFKKELRLRKKMSKVTRKEMDYVLDRAIEDLED